MRGLHRQVPPYAEAKLVRCIRGAIADFAVDVRPDSPTYRKHVMVELTPGSHRALFVPPYVAHVPAAPHDLVVDVIVTESRILNIERAA